MIESALHPTTEDAVLAILHFMDTTTWYTMRELREELELSNYHANRARDYLLYHKWLTPRHAVRFIEYRKNPNGPHLVFRRPKTFRLK